MKNEKRGLVPRLRFPEFQHAGAWNSDLMKGLVTTVTPPKKLTSDQYENEGRFPVIDQSQDYICGWTNDEDALVSVESPLIVFGDHTCALKIIFQSFVQGADGIKILKSRDEVESEFLYQYLLFSPVKMESYKRHFSTLKEKLVVYPDKKTGEQQKIADCFSSLDALIAAQTEKLDALKTHKKGLMQQLFPQVGETVPRLRFPKFRDGGRWTSKKMSDVYRFLSTNTYSRDKLNYEKGEVKNIHYGDIHTKFSTLFDVTQEYVPYINRTESLERIKDDSYCLEGDIVFADASEDVEDVGKSIEIVNTGNEKILSGLHTLLARQKNNDLVIGFGGYLFKSGLIREQIKRESQGAKVLGISSGRLSKIKVCFPYEKREQQKIAHCLSSLDALIAAQAEKIDALKTHKKGLMQQLFPSLEEVHA